MIVRAVHTLLLLHLAAGCAGPDVDAPVDETDTVSPPAIERARIRRLSVREYDASLRLLLDDPARYGELYLPADPFVPFDNAVAWQEPSDALITGAERAALAAADTLRRDPARLERVMGCAPQDAGDVTCLRAFIQSFGRRALRRPLPEPEVDALLDVALTEAAATGDAADGAALIVAALLQDVGFLYRIETGAPLAEDPTRVHLDKWSIAERMAFLLTGAPPDDALLDAVEAGRMDTQAARQLSARTLLFAPGHEQHVLDLHAAWLGYREIPEIAEVADTLRDEADRLVRRVVFEDHAPWSELWTAPYAWLGAAEAERYGLDAAALSPAPTWVDLTGSGRSGLLAQGAFMSVANNPLDTSPTKRGKLIMQRLMCAPVGKPPPNVAADAPPANDLGACKLDRYRVHATDPGCAVCHDSLDGIGLGLERYDKIGGYRTEEPIPFSIEFNPDCPLPEGGEAPEIGAFNSPAQLAAKLVELGLAQDCAVRHLVAFHEGADVNLAANPEISALASSFEASGFDLQALLVELASSDAFTVVEVGL